MSAAVMQSLSRMHAFRALPPSELESLAKAFAEKTVEAGKVLIKEGKKDREIFVLIEGEILVHRTRGTQRIELNRLSAGAWVGLVALVDSGPRSASCEAVTACRVASLGAKALEAMALSNEALAIALYEALGAQLSVDFRGLDQRIRSLL